MGLLIKPKPDRRGIRVFGARSTVTSPGSTTNGRNQLVGTIVVVSEGESIQALEAVQ